MTRPFTAYIGMGTNLGDRRANLDSALEALAAHEGIEVVRSSAIVETDPLPAPGAPAPGPPGPHGEHGEHASPAAASADAPDAPCAPDARDLPDAGGPYLNAVVQVRTSLTARALLDACLAIEAAHGRRRRGSSRWASRPLDLDVLLFGDALIDEPGLRIPHPRMHEREFVLGPLAEIAPGVVHPGLGRSIECLRDQCRRRQRHRGGRGEAGVVGPAAREGGRPACPDLQA